MDDEYRMHVDSERREFRYYRDAVDRHWDPADLDPASDTEKLVGLDRDVFDDLRRTVAMFGAGEQAVTEELAPLAAVLDDIEGQMFLTTQLYEESKHTDFFYRYWRDAVNPAERERGLEPTSPTAEHWFNEGYDEFFGRVNDALQALLEEDAPERRAAAYSHYHLAAEGVLAQTGYYSITATYGNREEQTPDLDVLTTGIDRIRRDEGRHVGFGMARLQKLVDEDGVDSQYIRDVVAELLPLINQITTGGPARDFGAGPDLNDLQQYAMEKHQQRMKHILDDEELPSVDELTKLDD